MSSLNYLKVLLLRVIFIVVKIKYEKDIKDFNESKAKMTKKQSSKHKIFQSFRN